MEVTKNTNCKKLKETMDRELKETGKIIYE